MAIDKSLAITACLSLGAAGLVLAFLGGAWPNPLPQGPLDDERSLLRIWAAGAAVDAACSRGDLGAFADAVTPALRERLAQRLAAVDRPLDGTALRELGRGRQRPYAELLVQPLLAGEVRGEHVVVAVRRPERDGAQVLTFVWDGRTLRLDDSRHEPAVQTTARARTAVEAVASRRR